MGVNRYGCENILQKYPNTRLEEWAVETFKMAR